MSLLALSTQLSENGIRTGSKRPAAEGRKSQRGKRKRERPHHDRSPNPRQGAKETAHGRRPPFARGASSCTASCVSRTLSGSGWSFVRKQNRLNSSFKLSMWLGSHLLDPDQNSLRKNSWPNIGPSPNPTLSNIQQSTTPKLSRFSRHSRSLD